MVLPKANTRSLKFLILATLYFAPAETSHFRGSLITWKPLATYPGSVYEVEVSLRIAWRRSYAGWAYCDDDTIAQRVEIGSGSLECRSGCSGTLIPMYYNCTDYSLTEDWSGGVGVYRVNVTAPVLEASFTSCCWISTLVAGADGDWEVRVRVDLTTRADTGRINTSPTSAISPIVRLQYGCSHTIVIPVEDEDRDHIRCRWASSTLSECADVCGLFTGATLNENRCEIYYDAVGSTGWHAVALQIEDFATRSSTVPLSSVPLQFLVDVFYSNMDCAAAPVFVHPTRTEGSCVAVPFNTTFMEQIVVATSSPSVSIVAIDTVSPLGLTKSAVQRSNTSDVEYYILVTWSPELFQYGPNIFCFTAVDSAGLSSDERCITLLGGVEAPVVVPRSRKPVGEVLSNQSEWRMRFNGPIVRPSSSHFITFFSEDGTAVIAFDTSASPNVLFPDTEFGTTLRVFTDYTFKEGSSYYITLDPGAIVGPAFCGNGLDSGGELDPDFWSFTIRDITPPHLTFILAPHYSNGTITVSWVFNEEATVICTLQTPEDFFMTSCSGDLFFMSGLSRGTYTLFIQGTDNAGNVANIVTHTWEVDVEAPIAVFTSTPDPVSNTDSWDFTFECTNEIYCTFLCSVQLVGDQSNFVDCYGSFAVSGLVDGGSYVIYVTPIDAVGNIGNTIDYQWSIDLLPPTITPLSNVSFTCGDPYSPEQAGTPMATDDDSTPTLSYEDSPEVGCSLSRLWIARDDAGNEATTVQIITFTSPSPPSITDFSNVAVIPCSNLKDAIRNAQLLQNQLQVSHPCDRPVVITYQDSAELNRCGFNFTRTWLLVDDCGLSGTFLQNIQVLDQLSPISPEDGEVNVGINDPLIWPQYPGGTSYEIYLWTDGTEQPTVPIAVVEELTFYPSPSYPPGTACLWQIRYILQDESVIPSPIWRFEVRSYLDFNVTSITLPAFTFSGQNFEVTWVITNIGNLSTGGRFWTDSVYMSPDSDFQNSRRVSSVLQERFIDPDDDYTSQVTVNLGHDEIGTFYVFVQTDTYNELIDFDRMNNLKVSSRPLEVKLSPPPNLIVENIIVPSSSFSGEDISVVWTVRNVGLGITATDVWYDKIYWSSDDILDDDDLLFATVAREGALAVGSSYTNSTTVMVPRAIFGNFFIIVATDALGMVYEHTGEGDGVTSSEDITVTLTPPPDLTVTDISTADTLVTGEEMVVQYTVTNIGAGAPFEPYWRDQIKFGDKVICSLHIYESLGPGESYTRECKYVIPTAFQSGLINLNITTDYNNQVFEYLSEGNNFESRSIQILQSLADLIVDKIATTLVSSYEGNYILVNYSVVNNGTGPTINAPWTEIIGFSFSDKFNWEDIIVNRQIVMSANLPGYGQLVNRRNIRMDVPEYITNNKVYIHIFVDTENRIEEWNEDNNIRTSEPVDIPLVAADLAVVELTYMPELRQYSGSEVTVTWTVTNKGNRVLVGREWFDSVMFSASSDITDNFINSTAVPVSHTLVPGSNYTQSQVVHIPDGLRGRYFIHVKVDSQSDVFEDGLNDNNVLSIPVNILIPPSPDFIVKSVSGNVFVTEGKTRILLVNGIILNHGNSLLFEAFWVDEIYITDQLPFSKDSAIKLDEVMNTGYLESFQEYTIVRSIIIPDNVTGSFYVAIVVDTANNIVEVLGEENNDGHSDETIYIRPPLLPILAVNILFEKLPSRAIAGETFPLFYDITNKGEKDLPTSSFTSEIYLIPDVSGARRQVNGIFLRQIIHTLSLSVNETQPLSTNITMPYGVNQFVFLAVALDVKKVLSLGNTDNGVTQTEDAILVEDGPLANLLIRIGTSSSKLNLTSGQPANILYEVVNNGASATLGDWYETISLSRDNSLDAFDIKLKTVLRLMELDVNESYSQIIEVFIPYNIPTEDYYLFFSVDTENHIPEITESDNHVSRLVSIKETVSTDIAVQDVFATPENLTYNEDVLVFWKLVNKGQILAEGYKCDTLYLSEDEKWDITDYQIGDPLCSAISIEPFDNVSMAAVSFSLEARVPDDIVPNTYKALVHTRSNIRDANLKNNFATSVFPLNIVPPSLDLGSRTRITMFSGEEKIFRIYDVPDGETLIAILYPIKGDSLYDLYFSFNRPPTPSDCDAYSQFPFSANQTVILKKTNDGTYFLKINSLADEEFEELEIDILVKIAGFEILQVSPTEVSPLGTATVQILGTVFDYDLAAYLFDQSNPFFLLETTRVYRFSSIESYATFDITGIPFGTYSVQLRNLGTNDTAELNGGLNIVKGIPGQASIDMALPEHLQAGDSGIITVLVENVGNTDIFVPCLSMQTNGDAVVRLIDQNMDPTSKINFLALSSNGPGGILPPKATTTVSLEIVQLRSFSGSALIQLSSIPDTNEPHSYLDKESFKPDEVSDDTWDVIWENFIQSVGTTWLSFKLRISEVANELSLVDGSAYLLDDIVAYQLRVANGLLTGKELLTFVDLTDKESDSLLALKFERGYSSFISLRRKSGPLGQGWLLPWWELRIDVQSDLGLIFFFDKGERITLKRRRENVYGLDGLEAYKSDENYILRNEVENVKYIFEPQNGSLVKMESLLDGNFIAVEHNGAGQKELFHHSNGKTMRVTYTATGLILFVDILDTDFVVLQTSTYTYDETGRYLLAVTVNGKSTNYTYSEAGDLIMTTYDSGQMRVFKYNSWNFLQSNELRYPDGRLAVAVDISFSWNGIVYTTLRPQNQNITFIYDASGSLSSFRINNDLPIKQAQSTSGWLSQLLGDTVISEDHYDIDTNTLHQRDGNRNTISYKFGTNGEILQYTDAVGNSYNSVFDNFGRLRQTTFPDGSSEGYAYDIVGRLSSLTKPSGQTISFTYDSDNNLVTKSSGRSRSNRQYDGSGRLANITNDIGRTSIKYDQNGVPIEVAYPNGHSLFYGYNSKYQRVYLADNRGYNITYEYDNRDRIIQIRDSTTNYVYCNWEYDKSIHPIKRTVGNGAFTLYKYEEGSSRLLEVHNYLPGGGVSSWFIYEYDLRGQVIAVVTADGRWEYSYDSNGQLVQWRRPNGVTVDVTYDSRGNRIWQRNTDGEFYYVVNEMNQALVYGENEDFLYDGNGNLIRRTTDESVEYYQYDADGKLLGYEYQDVTQCSYQYDPIGNLYQKVCDDIYNTNYLVDPFGPFGPDIIAEDIDGDISYFVSSFEQGLVATVKPYSQPSSPPLYFEYNGDGSVVAVLDYQANKRNTYDYDPFGNILEMNEQVRNNFLYAGKLGVMLLEETGDKYWMRTRVYDPLHGRFTTPDPLGFSGGRTNSYAYAYNSPLAVKDVSATAGSPLLPTIISGNVLHRQAVKAALQAGLNAAIAARKVISVATIALSTEILADYSWGGVIGAVPPGPAGQAADLNSGRGLLKKTVGNLFGGLVSTGVETTSVNREAAAWSCAVSNTFYNLGFSSITAKISALLGDLTVPENTGWLNSQAFLSDFFIRPPQSYFGSLITSYFIGMYNSYFFDDQLKGTRDEIIGNIEWAQSVYPNYILGPPGFGPGHFVPLTQVFEYTIRFENDPNATAPAQRVLIRHQLDDDLDIRTFRVGSFGFGDFISEESCSSSFLQVTLDLTATLGLYVQMISHVDVVTRHATWELQCLDPETGEVPVDPSIGFLPPNNGTNGQGFVKFSIKPIEDALTLSTIDVTASIMIDENEPILTPPIFNTLDGTSPSCLLKVVDLLESGTSAIFLNTSDTGSGVKKVDLYICDDELSVTPLVFGITDSVINLPLAPGSTYRIIAIATDHVGNMQGVDDMDNVFVIDFPLLTSFCPNNCSGSGNCTTLGTCVCESGSFGNDCSDDKPPEEFLILEISTPGGDEDMPILVYVSARYPTDGSNLNTIEVHVISLPEGSTFDKGTYVDGKWVFRSDDFGDAMLTLPEHYSGEFLLEAEAIGRTADNRVTRRSGALRVTINEIVDSPYLNVSDTCYEIINSNRFGLHIDSYAIGRVESLSAVLVYGIPEGYSVIGQSRNGNGAYSLNISNISDVEITFNGSFSKLSLQVTAISSVPGRGSNSTTVNQSVDFCSQSDSTHTESNADSGAVAGIVIGVLIVICICVAVVLIVVLVYRHRVSNLRLTERRWNPKELALQPISFLKKYIKSDNSDLKETFEDQTQTGNNLSFNNPTYEVGSDEVEL